MCSQTVVYLTLFISSQVSLHVAGELPKDCKDQTCLTEDLNPSAGSKLLQVDRSNVQRESSASCINSRLGRTIPLDEDGLEDVAESCCYDDMKDFIRRLAAEMDLQVCCEGGLSGFAPFFSCTNTTSLADLKGYIRGQIDPKTRCQWLGQVGMKCPKLDPSCGARLKKEESLFKGYMGLDAENNPPALVTNGKVKDAVKKVIADKLGVPVDQVEVVIGTGPVDSVSLYQVVLKSPKTGKYVEAGLDGSLVASSTSLKTLYARHAHGSSFLVSSGSNEEVLVKWDKDTLSFQAESGDDALEDQDGRVIFGRSPDRRLQVDFPGYKSAATSDTPSSSFISLGLRRACTVVVSYQVLQTSPPTLDAEKVQDTAEKLNVTEFQTNISGTIAKVEPCVGRLKLSTFKFCKSKGSCEDKSLKLAHTDRDYNHQGNHVPEEDVKPDSTAKPDSTIKLVVTSTDLAHEGGNVAESVFNGTDLAHEGDNVAESALKSSTIKRATETGNIE
jgi:hypothetical protein